MHLLFSMVFVTKKVFGYILGDFFTNSSGHPAAIVKSDFLHQFQLERSSINSSAEAMERKAFVAILLLASSCHAVIVETTLGKVEGFESKWD
jgi:hypothetical protein